MTIAREGESKRFFLKKEEKTFIHSDSVLPELGRGQMYGSFLVLFFKKEPLTLSTPPHHRIGSLTPTPTPIAGRP
jgi:hypothetical protein